MTVAVHLGNVPEGEHPYTKAFIALAKRHNSHHFIFIYDGNRIPKLNLPDNCTPVLLGPEIKNSLVKYYWYNYKLPRTIKRYNADYLFTTGNTCSSKVSVPQCMLVNAVPAKYKMYNDKFLLKSLGIAERIVFPDEFQLMAFEKKYKQFSNKIKIVPFGIPEEFKIASYEESEVVKENLTSGNDYFLTVLPTRDQQSAVKLFKAYSIFKKWQKSSIKLVLINRAAGGEGPVPDFHLYKYRHDVLIINNPSLTEEAGIFSGAYAFLDLYNSSSTAANAMCAMKSGVPVISNAPESPASVLSDAAIMTSDVESGFAEKIMLLYKDEALRKQRIAKGADISSAYTVDQAAMILSGIAGLPLLQTS